MKFLKIVSVFVGGSLLSGCCLSRSLQGSEGPELVSKGYAAESGSYAEVGIKFTNSGDFFALVNPGRWKSPVATGGSLSWLNPGAWSEDAGRTGRILAGEAALIGGAVVGYAIGSGGSLDAGGGSVPPPPASGGTRPPSGPP